MSFNKIIICGNLGREPELRYTPQGNAVCNLNVATTEKKRGKTGEFENVTTWFRVTLWGKQAENASKFLQKGSPVYVMGSLTLEEWTDRDGNNRTTLNVNAIDMQFIGGGRAESSGDLDEAPAVEDEAEEAAPAPKAKAAAATGSAKKSAAKKRPADDDLPF